MSRVCVWFLLTAFACAVGLPAVGKRRVAAQPVTNEEIRTRKEPRKVRVPSRRFRTIQSAIDALPSGSTIRLTKKLYDESITVAHKVINIVGASRRRPVVLRSSQEGRAIITFGPGGGGVLENLHLQRGAAGIVGVTRLYPDESEELPAKVSVQGCQIRGCAVGVYGEFSSITMRAVTIQDMTWYALYMLGAETLQVYNAWISDCGNAGIVIFNWEDSGTIRIANTSCHFNEGGGIVVVGDAKHVEIDGCECLANGLAGILLLEVGSVDVDNCYVGLTYAVDAPEKFGVADGLLVTGETSAPWIEVTNSDFVNNERAGLMFLSASGMVKNCVSAFNMWGIVLQGSPLPNGEDLDIDFTDNSEGNVYKDGDLEIPDESLMPDPLDDP